MCGALYKRIDAGLLLAAGFRGIKSEAERRRNDQIGY